MSIALMSLAWKTGLPSGQKMVLLALCDNANDQGECYPSISMLSDKCSISERSVQQHIHDLEVAGIVSREMRNGRSTLYRVHSDHFDTPANSAPRKIRTPQNLHPAPADTAPPPPQPLHPTPATAAPITIKEPSIEPSGNRQKARKKPEPALPVVIDLPDWLPLDAWNGYLDMRREKKKVPTEHAVKLLLADLAKWHAKGHDIAAALNASIRNGWTDVYEPKTPPPAAAGAQLGAVSQLSKAGQATARNIEAWMEQKRKEQNHG